jgi:hypothetical protein
VVPASQPIDHLCGTAAANNNSNSSTFCVVNRLRQQTITFGDMALLHPQRRDELLDALRLATGLNVVEVEIKRMDLKKKSAQIMVSYDEAAVAPPAVPPEEERNVDSEAPKAP